MPKTTRQNFTKQLVETARPQNKPYRLWDSKVPGLALRVLTSGKGTYELHWKRGKSTAIGPRGAMTLEGARLKAIKLLGEVQESGSIKPSTSPKIQTWGQFVEQKYGPYIREAHKAGGATLAALKLQFSFLNSKNLADIDKNVLSGFAASRLKQGRASSTVNRDMDRIRAALGQAVHWGLIDSNPLARLKKLKQSSDNHIRYLTHDEESRLRKALSDREMAAKEAIKSSNKRRNTTGQPKLAEITGFSDHLMPMVLVALNTGLRRGELTTLEWSAIDLTAQRLTVHAGYAKSATTRHVQLNSEAVSILVKHRASSNGQRPFPVVDPKRAWKTVLKAAKIEKFRFHDLRHTFASNLVMSGVDLNTVRDLMGHGSISMTLHYAHLAPEYRMKAVESLVKKKAVAKT
ncbi:site-specific integrase [Pseudoxanthomonas sp. CF125]|uniref:site-specific integrase n=1 Tax=Pseudoxanthomonas sp. CF125 TaxID=1855303 RepID=UPI0008847F4A|nr:site-specific integrase [Pseudoxanthomonas sp. CF125]SDQ24318.1 Site-specific recombinase XerD [Pseudoxanthomonas sp. CF125]